MLKEKLNDLIKKAIIEKDKIKLETLRSVKTAFLNFETSKNALPLDEGAEIRIIKKLISSREESIQQFRSAGRIDLAEIEEMEVKILSEYLPAPISDSELEEYTKTLITPETGKKDMGRIVKEVKSKFPTADGKQVATIVSRLL